VIAPKLNHVCNAWQQDANHIVHLEFLNLSLQGLTNTKKTWSKFTMNCTNSVMNFMIPLKNGPGFQNGGTLSGFNPAFGGESFGGEFLFDYRA
jgi:hypothetical protein